MEKNSSMKLGSKYETFLSRKHISKKDFVLISTSVELPCVVGRLRPDHILCDFFLWLYYKNKWNMIELELAITWLCYINVPASFNSIIFHLHLL